ncbi:MAG: G-protein-signaling modulator 2 [Microcystis aeruginosa CACIAM 03]|nr:MAG: G-protein-signaling modulator 2 [Microcystis aeruginosa CACIAM 03]
MNNETSSIIDQNEREYEGLIVSLEANQERLNILICVCDQEKLREEIIDRYSKELEPVIPCYRIDLDQKEPSLRAAIASLVSRKPDLLQSKNAVITTTGVEKLHSIEWQQEKSELDKFFGYLQWTREGLREFPYSIVLWVTSTVEVNLRKKSPDFWSWRKGVFRFISPPSNFLPCQEFLPILQSFDEITIDKDIPLISKEDLLELIEQIEVNKGKKEPRLASLYASLAKIYNHRLLNLPLSDYRQEQQLAIEYYQKAIDLQKELNLELDLVASLDSLAGIYYFLGEYQKAIEFYQQSLAIKREISDITGEAYSYLGLGNVYDSLGEYQKAIEFYQKSLAIFQEMEYIIGEPKTLFNLGLTYYKLKRISEAKEAILQARKLFQALGLAGYVQYCDQAIRRLET